MGGGGGEVGTVSCLGLPDRPVPEMPEALLRKLQLDVTCDWSTTIPTRERCGVLFQQTTLVDELTVAGNLAVALELHDDSFSSANERDLKIKQLLDMVGLEYGKDAHKLPSELSGG